MLCCCRTLPVYILETSLADCLHALALMFVVAHLAVGWSAQLHTVAAAEAKRIAWGT